MAIVGNKSFDVIFWKCHNRFVVKATLPPTAFLSLRLFCIVFMFKLSRFKHNCSVLVFFFLNNKQYETPKFLCFS